MFKKAVRVLCLRNALIFRTRFKSRNFVVRGLKYLIFFLTNERRFSCNGSGLLVDGQPTFFNRAWGIIRQFERSKLRLCSENLYVYYIDRCLRKKKLCIDWSSTVESVGCAMISDHRAIADHRTIARQSRTRLVHLKNDTCERARIVNNNLKLKYAYPI